MPSLLITLILKWNNDFEGSYFVFEPVKSVKYTLWCSGGRLVSVTLPSPVQRSSAILFVIIWHLTPFAPCLLGQQVQVAQISMAKVSLSVLIWVSCSKGERMHLLALTDWFN